MTAREHRCSDGGNVVGADSWLPDTSFDFDWGSDYPRIGCNQLRCDTCGQSVRSLVGRERDGSGPDLAAAALYALADLSQAPNLAPSTTGRVYVCRCLWHVEHATRPLHPHIPDPSQAFETHWHCDGHPPLDLPGTLDGVTLDPAIDFDALARAALARRLPTQRPFASFVDEKRHPAFWLARLYVLADQPPYPAAIGGAAGRALDDSDPWVRRGAINFFRFHPTAPGGHRLVDALTKHRRLFDGVPDPENSRRDIGYYLREALERRLDLVASDGTPLDPAAHMAASTDLIAGRGTMGFLFRVGRHKPDWLVANGPQIVTRDPSLLDALVRVFRNQPTSLAVRLVDTLARSGATTPDALRTALKALSEPNRSAMLDAIPR